MITIYEVLHQKFALNPDKLFNKPTTQDTRGHLWRLAKPQEATCVSWNTISVRVGLSKFLCILIKLNNFAYAKYRANTASRFLMCLYTFKMVCLNCLMTVPLPYINIEEAAGTRHRLEHSHQEHIRRSATPKLTWSARYPNNNDNPWVMCTIFSLYLNPQLKTQAESTKLLRSSVSLVCAYSCITFTFRYTFRFVPNIDKFHRHSDSFRISMSFIDIQIRSEYRWVS